MMEWTKKSQNMNQMDNIIAMRKKQNVKIRRRKIKDIIKENDILRGLVANLKKPCHYCGLEDMSKCAYGFPGCALADDILIGSMTTETEMYKRWENESKEFEDYDDEYYFSHDATDWMKRQLKTQQKNFL